jgi:hypothetical protein
MKKKIIISAILAICLFKVGFGQVDTTLQKLLLINYTAFNGHPVDSLVKSLPSGYTKTVIISSHRGDYGNVLAVFYPNDVNVWIQVKKFKYMNPWLNKTDSTLSATVNWDISLFKKEAMAFAIVYQGAACWAGCANDPRSTAP